MAWFSTPSKPDQPTTEEVHAAGRALQHGKQAPADRLVAMTPGREQDTAMRVLGAAADYEPRA